VKGNLIATHLSGDFTLPKNLQNPLAFIAGGIGITPFRSMIKFLTDKNLQSDIVLLYLVKKREDLIFQDVFQEAKKIGLKVIPIIGSYHLTNADIQKNIPDAGKRVFYISGPQPMVQGLTSILKSLHVKKIKTDFFPGY
jgi:ferredoxin-NADP reductase